MTASVLAGVFLAAYVLSHAACAMAAPGVQPSIAQAEERVMELAKILSDIKNSIRPRHCEDLLHAGQTLSGLYTVFPLATDLTGKIVYCDMDTDGGGWTVIQRRGQYGNDVYYFYRNWTEYAMGFGDPAKEHWIGNNVLHVLTSDPEEMALRIVLTNHTGDTVSVDYERIQVGSEEEFFKLKLGKHLGPPGWDSLSNGNDCGFTTYDQDHDKDAGNCAVTFRGAWWYEACHRSNLNGLNYNGPHESYADGIEWSVRDSPVDLQHYSYPKVQMMIRPAGSQIDRRSNALSSL